VKKQYTLEITVQCISMRTLILIITPIHLLFIFLLILVLADCELAQQYTASALLS